jgi:hypothetical protein
MPVDHLKLSPRILSRRGNIPKPCACQVERYLPLVCQKPPSDAYPSYGHEYRTLPKWEDPARREIAAYTVAPALIRKPAPPLLYLPFINENDKGNDRKQSAAAICGNKAFLRTGLHWRDVLVSFLKYSVHPDDLAVRAPSGARSDRRRCLN